MIIKESNRKHASHDRPLHEETRPWGSFAVLEEGRRFKVKRLVVNPHARLSLQLHRSRSEYWVVVAGCARVTRGVRRYDLGEWESMDIPRMMKHRIENPSDRPLEIIEVQSGAYLGEDDIIRFSDDYGRANGATAPDASASGHGSSRPAVAARHLQPSRD
jgi:mannose-1-phosphate guanylyltransferase/mannose-6-phosphate isomerase